ITGAGGDGPLGDGVGGDRPPGDLCGTGWAGEQGGGHPKQRDQAWWVTDDRGEHLGAVGGHALPRRRRAQRPRHGRSRAGLVGRAEQATYAARPIRRQEAGGVEDSASQAAGLIRWAKPGATHPPPATVRAWSVRPGHGWRGRRTSRATRSSNVTLRNRPG